MDGHRSRLAVYLGRLHPDLILKMDVLLLTLCMVPNWL